MTDDVYLRADCSFFFGTSGSGLANFTSTSICSFCSFSFGGLTKASSLSKILAKTAATNTIQNVGYWR